MGQQQSQNSMINQGENLKSEIEDKTDALKSEIGSIESKAENGGMLSSILFWLGIILLLIFLGFNIFTYLGDAGEYLKSLFAPILSFFGFTIGETAKQTVKVAGEGTKGLIDAASGVTTSGINLLEKQLTNVKDQDKKSVVTSSNDDEEVPTTTQISSQSPTNKSYEKMDVFPSGKLEQINLNKSSKSLRDGPAYCYVGTDKNVRSCINVLPRDECLSGDIFPSNDICINPNLRG